MTENKMYSQRAKQGNISVVRICLFDCGYCAFERFRKMSKCQKCRDNIPHSHMEVLQRTPPKTKEGEFLTVGLSGDISFMPLEDFWQVIEYCRKWNDRTFLIQSKNPAYFLRFDSFKIPVPDNVILGTTIETNRNKEIWTIHDPLKKRIDYADLSKAPAPYLRTTAMVQLQCRKAVTIEPILSFSEDIFVDWILKIHPEFVYVGYNSKSGLKLPEPALSDTLKFVHRLRNNGIEVREKLLRRAFYE